MRAHASPTRAPTANHVSHTTHHVAAAPCVSTGLWLRGSPRILLATPCLGCCCSPALQDTTNSSRPPHQDSGPPRLAHTHRRPMQLVDFYCAAASRPDPCYNDLDTASQSAPDPAAAQAAPVPSDNNLPRAQSCCGTSTGPLCVGTHTIPLADTCVGGSKRTPGKVGEGMAPYLSRWGAGASAIGSGVWYCTG